MKWTRLQRAMIRPDWAIHSALEDADGAALSSQAIWRLHCSDDPPTPALSRCLYALEANGKSLKIRSLLGLRNCEMEFYRFTRTFLPCECRRGRTTENLGCPPPNDNIHSTSFIHSKGKALKGVCKSNN